MFTRVAAFLGGGEMAAADDDAGMADFRGIEVRAGNAEAYLNLTPAGSGLRHGLCDRLL
jgi:hypothetical protein